MFQSGTTEVNESEKLLGQSGLTIRSACTTKDLILCCNLVYEEYLAQNYLSRCELPLHFSKYMLFPDTKTGILENGGRALGTGSIVKYSALGLPSSYLFDDELNRYARAGEIIAEGTLFASRSLSPAAAALLASFGIAAAKKQGIDRLFLVVNPKHVQFWQSYMNFRICSQQKSCTHVAGASGILLNLALGEELPARVKRLLLRVEKQLDLDTLNVRLRTLDIINLLRLKPLIWAELGDLEKLTLEQQYPGIINKAEQAILLNSFAFN